MSRDVAQTMHEILSLAFHRSSSALISWRPISVPAYFPTVMGFFWVLGTSLHLQLPVSVAGPCLITLFCFTFFILPDYEWIFLVLLGVQRPPLLFTKYSVENYSISRCILGIYICVCVCEEGQISQPPILPTWLLLFIIIFKKYTVVSGDAAELDKNVMSWLLEHAYLVTV